MRARRLALSIVLAGAVGACLPEPPAFVIDAAVLKRHGSWTYRASREAVTQAAALALRQDGFALASVGPGVVVTRLRVLTMARVGYGYGPFLAGGYAPHRAFRLVARVAPAGGDRVRLTIEPQMYVGGTRVRGEFQRGWVMHRFRVLLRRVYDALPKRAAPASAPASSGAPASTPSPREGHF